MQTQIIEQLNRIEQEHNVTLLYALRPILCCERIVRHHTQPPMHINELLKASCAASPQLKQTMADLIQIKKDKTERFAIERTSILDVFLQEQLNVLSSRIPKNPSKTDLALYDKVFRDIVTGSISLS